MNNLPQKVRQLQTDYNERVWFYREHYETNEYGTKYYRNWYCYHCKGEFALNVPDNYQYGGNTYQKESTRPYREHKEFIKSAQVNGDWNQKITANYYKALCCKCFADCDCLEWIAQEQKKEQISLQEYKNKLQASEKTLFLLSKMIKVEVRDSIGKEEIDQLTEKHLKEYLAQEEKRKAGCQRDLALTQQELHKLTEWKAKIQILHSQRKTQLSTKSTEGRDLGTRQCQLEEGYENFKTITNYEKNN